ncbi:hypothetical protein [Caldimonas brevitalea]|uniref:Uncharacterized protein n=1 Tax=Caldimonas brevitalea TaxID=413882 RepID=A0A0G3BQH7_9BURK|nr:hypothetical protein [Caldimonas brevitalea]AKJ29626.1 hypothetical protein AAW51_2935 [Caldimonas brevitalea]
MPSLDLDTTPAVLFTTLSERDHWIARCAARLRLARPGIDRLAAIDFAASVWLDSQGATGPDEAAQQQLLRWPEVDL